MLLHPQEPQHDAFEGILSHQLQADHKPQQECAIRFQLQMHAISKWLEIKEKDCEEEAEINLWAEADLDLLQRRPKH